MYIDVTGIVHCSFPIYGVAYLCFMIEYVTEKHQHGIFGFININFLIYSLPSSSSSSVMAMAK